MKYECFDKLKLKDGRIGWIVDVLGKGEAFVFELDKKGFKDRVIQIEKKDILEKIA
ncbi:MAG: hypothetical protein PHI94_01195 [Eubacteriaceae bacterium]|nr:hypothetical protein [Eubacteriaceae bacterium]MDD4508146.1 hypothetical protein [Eubacteriaceae bacterium]